MPHPTPPRATRVILCFLALAGSALTLGANAQAVPKTPPTKWTYDVASIRPNNTGGNSVDIDENDNTFVAQNVPLIVLLEDAFHIKRDMISGLPGWADSKRFDINAKVLDADPKEMHALKDNQRRWMLQQLLIDRFHLQTHTETKTQSVYDLVVVKGGIKFKPSAVQPKADEDDDDRSMNTHNTHLTASRIKLSDLADFLSDQVHRIVIDKTGLTPRYDLDLQWTRDMDSVGENGTAKADEPPPLTVAIEEQLGLKLVPDKGPVDALIVDHVEQPSEN